jgi:hypothetical protein
VLDLYFAVLSNRDFSYQTKFLLLAQALEVYHARSSLFPPADLQAKIAHRNRVKAIMDVAPVEYKDWLKKVLANSNRKTLAQRIEEILNLHRDETMRLTAKISDFPAKVRRSRNYYTHYSEKLWQSDKIAKGSELMRIGFILQDLLKICLLKEIGIQGNPIERVLASNASSKLIHLETPPVQPDALPHPGLLPTEKENLPQSP